MKKSINCRVLIQADGDLYKIGDVIVKTFEGDIYYRPSNDTVLKIDGSKEKIEHFSWHKSGYVHLKKINYPNQKIRMGQKIKDTGYQKLFVDVFIFPSKLKKFNKKTRQQDIIFLISGIEDLLSLELSLVSGKLIVKNFQDLQTPLSSRHKSKVKGLLGIQKRALGFESGNSDKILQYCLYKFMGEKNDIKTGRRIYIPGGYNISNH